ncbi:MAG: four helix bundle protein [Thermoanaerobaculia bacterium]
MSARPEYKSHPLWAAAMDLARDAYALAEGLRTDDAEASRRLRRAAVRVPARIAGALSASAEGRTEHVLAARGALAEVTRQARRAGSVPPSAPDLAARAERLDPAVLFELGIPEGQPSS